MALHSLTSVTIGVPDVTETAAFYGEFGLEPEGDGWFTTRDGGRQLHIVWAPTRRLVELRVGVDHPDDLVAVAARLTDLGIQHHNDLTTLIAYEKVTKVFAVLEVTDPLLQDAAPDTPCNGPGRLERADARAPGVLRSNPVRPRKLGQVVVGTTDLDRTTTFFREGIGLSASDYLKDEGVFLRCSTDHHNLLLLTAPVGFLHRTSWQVDDVDEIGRGAAAMLKDHPERHVWGLGRHRAGSHFFWYLKDPAGNFTAYYSDMDCIVDDRLWTPEALDGTDGLLSWGPPPPPSFLHPEDLADLMTEAHAAP
ncbi:VOC family protein [Streptomyces sp. WMMC500]|uniref:VOC family protein n=1 Tax=Streptomyces sp. WMMC500 TaxID=3015154 RepID=UPI00248B162A|nr:VOC family protein [Streptomyces sp. WMMC500]WBB62025.1 VOC family protein [Streptomyces sp. WMMC500]